MRILIGFILKIIGSLVVGLMCWLHIVLALLFWDSRFMELDDGMKYIWKDSKHSNIF